MAFLTMKVLTRFDAVRYARERTEREGRVYVARGDFDRFFVVPLYEDGKEGRQYNTRYAVLGTVVAESLPDNRTVQKDRI